MKNQFNQSQPGNQVQQFYNEEFGGLDVLIICSKPYFPATECAKILGYSNPHKAINDHCPHLTKREVGVQTGIKADGSPALQAVEKSFIPEGDLYRLIIRSKLSAAMRFESWLVDTVLPSIRIHGAYIMPETLDEMVASPEFAIALLNQLQKEREKNAELAPKAKYYDKILQCKNSVPISLVAKDYGFSAASFNSLLHDLGVQYKIAGTWLLYQQYAGLGYTQTKTYQYNEDSASMHTCWTQRGRLFLYEFLQSYDIVPLAELYDGDEDVADDDFEDDASA